MTDWLKFFVVRLPVALVVVALIAEALASLLSGVTPHRSNVDDLANAVLFDKHPYPVVLLGDSVTHNVVHHYRIGDSYEVGDLTTHARAGLVSEMFLLRRYLESGHRPKIVVLAASRGVYIDALSKDMFDYYVSSVFKRPDERSFLQQHYSDYVDYRWRPAALTMTTSLGEPIFSLIRHPGNDIVVAPEVPAAEPVLEHYSESELNYSQSLLDDRIGSPAEIRPEIKAILREFAAMSRKYDFALHLVWPPVETRLLAAWKATGKPQHIDEELVELFKEQGIVVAVDDVNAEQKYPAFDHDLIHVRGPGWEQVYANQLTAYIKHWEGKNRTDMALRR